MKNRVSIIKIGGNVLDCPEALSRFVSLFVRYPGNKILVHGGGAMATETAARLHLPVQMHEGRRITDAPTLKLVTMIYAGWVNKDLVARLQARGCRAIGLSGADANCIPARKRPVKDIDYGYVGDIEASGVNTPFLELLLLQNLCPVCCSITHDGKGNLLNTNADTIASTLAVALSANWDVALVYCFEKEGVIYNNSVLPVMSRKFYGELKEKQVITSGMIPKLDNAFWAVEKGVSRVCVKHALQLDRDGGTELCP